MSISLKVQTKSLATKTSSIKSIADKLVSLHDELYTISRNMDTDITSRPGIARDMKSCLDRLQEDYNRIGDYSRALQNVAITYKRQEEDLLTMVGQLEDKVAQETNRTGTQDYRRNSDKKNDRETRKTSDNVPPANMVASVEDMFDISSYSIRDNMKARVPRFPEDVKVNNRETTEGKDASDTNLMGMKATMQRLCKHSKLEFDAGNVVDGMFHHEVEKFLDDYDTYHPKKYLVAAYRALPDKYRIIVLKHWLDLIEEGEAINQSNLLPESYYEDIPYIPLEDSKLGRITAENKYASEEAYVYYKKYIYPLDAYLELHHEFKPKHSLDQEIERRHYQEWARMVYGSSKDEQGEEFRFGLFMGTGLGAMKAYVDIADMLYQLGTDPETRKAMGSLFVALLTCRYSSKSRDTLAKMIKQSVQIWQETYEEADPSNKGMMISSLITETITLAIDAGAMAKGVKGFIEFIDNGGFYKMASKVAKMGKSVKRLLKMTPAQLIDKVKTIIKLGDKYEVILHSGDNVTIAFDEMTIAQRRVYDSLADGPLSGDVMVDRENAFGVVERPNSIISEVDRAKIDSWYYTPSDELYLKYKKVYDNPKYFNQNTGNPIYPGTNGDINLDGFINGEYTIETLQPNTIIDRYGSNGTGKYFSPDGSSFESRALPPFMNEQPYTRYKVAKPLKVKSGEIAPWFNQKGGGTQFLTEIGVDDLIENGYLKVIE